MSTNLIKDMEEFHHEMAKHDKRQAVAAKPTVPQVDIRRLRVELIMEEVVRELLPRLDGSKIYFAVDDDNAAIEILSEIADGIADSIVVLIGTAIAYGIPLQRVWDEVHRTNMAKLTIPCPSHENRIFIDNEVIVCKVCGGKGYIPHTDIKKRSDGKILKPDGWQPPQIKTIIEAEWVEIE